MTQSGVWHSRLPARVLLFLTLALAPLGIIGFKQNATLFNTAESRAELSLLALTDAAASGERKIIERTFGAAEAISTVIDLFIDNPLACRAFLARYLNASDQFAFVGFLPPSGVVDCSTAARPLDFSEYPSFEDAIANPRPLVEVNRAAPGSGRSVVIVNHPLFDDDTLKGFVSISVPVNKVERAEDISSLEAPLALATFNDRGQLLTSDVSTDEMLEKVPAGVDLRDLAKTEAHTFIATSVTGNKHVYAVVPAVPGVVYALAVWPEDGPVTSALQTPRFSVALPLMMWLASLFVAWFVIDRLVMRRISGLSSAMQSFAQNRRLPAFKTGRAMSAELNVLEDTFQSMASDLLHDEAEQEGRLREKSILLKEVHHRVKNNLQIISSIMNMQIRKATAPETKHALSRVQDRIMGLSGIHRILYQTSNLSQIDAAHLIGQIVEQSKAIGADAKVKVETDLAPMNIYPDQAVPLSMLVAEALTNAMKYIGAPEGEQATLSVTLSHAEDDHANLIIENSRSAVGPAHDMTSTGLGQQLIRAFVTQLNGKLVLIDEPTRYGLNVVFKIEDFSEDPVDY
ncbi:sensor histidine kinase [Tateyamaria armeniaca]|uniref:histidine kinase n=1 Tax=Tateyamaria armeniaca TaxID=2518930 RepID=A0ABW8UX71_9RHOB